MPDLNTPTRREAAESVGISFLVEHAPKYGDNNIVKFNKKTIVLHSLQQEVICTFL